MTREELFSEILAVRPGSDDLVYIERRGENYAWNRTALSNEMPVIVSDNNALSDAWIYCSERWPLEDDDADCWQAFFDDLLAEMESMASGDDRCRWPLDEPWPRGH